MNKTNFHRTTRILLTIVMMATSMGFTTIVGYCSMTESPVCCCDSECSSDVIIPSNVTSIEQPNSPCYSVKVVGGLSEISGVVPEIASLKSSMVTIEAITPVFQNTLPLTNTDSRLPLDFRDVTPSKSDIYIQISSFLI